MFLASAEAKWTFPTDIAYTLSSLLTKKILAVAVEWLSVSHYSVLAHDSCFVPHGRIAEFTCDDEHYFMTLASFAALAFIVAAVAIITPININLSAAAAFTASDFFDHLL